MKSNWKTQIQSSQNPFKSLKLDRRLHLLSGSSRNLLTCSRHFGIILSDKFLASHASDFLSLNSFNFSHFFNLEWKSWSRQNFLTYFFARRFGVQFFHLFNYTIFYSLFSIHPVLFTLYYSIFSIHSILFSLIY